MRPSPMITQGACVFPVVIVGMIEPSAIRRFFTPLTRRFASTSRKLIPPHLRRAGHMVHRQHAITYQVVKGITFDVARQDFAEVPFKATRP